MTRYPGFILAIALGLSACGSGEEVSQADTSALPAATPAPTQADFDAVGTEPFWGVKVRGNTLVLSRMDHADVTATAPAPDAMGETLVYWGDAFNLTIMTRACSDGMSDRKFPYEAEVRIGDEVLKGCADKAGVSAKPAS